MEMRRKEIWIIEDFKVDMDNKLKMKIKEWEGEFE